MRWLSQLVQVREGCGCDTRILQHISHRMCNAKEQAANWEHIREFSGLISEVSVIVWWPSLAHTFSVATGVQWGRGRAPVLNPHSTHKQPHNVCSNPEIIILSQADYKCSVYLYLWVSAWVYLWDAWLAFAGCARCIRKSTHHHTAATYTLKLQGTNDDNGPQSEFLDETVNVGTRGVHSPAGVTEGLVENGGKFSTAANPLARWKCDDETNFTSGDRICWKNFLLPILIVPDNTKHKYWFNTIINCLNIKKKNRYIIVYLFYIILHNSEIIMVKT